MRLIYFRQNCLKPAQISHCFKGLDHKIWICKNFIRFLFFAWKQMKQHRNCVLYGGLWYWKWHLIPDPSLSSERERDTAQFVLFWVFFPWHCLSEWCQGSCTRLWLFNLQLWQRVKRSSRWAEGEDKVLLKLRTWLIVKPNFRGSKGPVGRERSLERHSTPPSSGPENLPAVWKSRVEVTVVKMQHNKVTW